MRQAESLAIQPSSVQATLWTGAVCLWALIAIGGIGYFVLRTPLPVHDNIVELQRIADGSFWQVVRDSVVADGYFRPGMRAMLWTLYQAGPANYVTAFKAFHLLQLTAVVLLFIYLLRIRSSIEALAGVIAVCTLLGLHTFGWLVWEAVPVPAGLTILLCCLGVLALGQRQPSNLVMLGILALFGAGVLVAETGVLIWVLIVAAAVAKFPGVSWRVVVAATVILTVYFVLRAILLDAAVPSSFRRPTGFGLRTLEPDEIQERFGASPWIFYMYNVVGAWSSVLFAEPRRGVWVLPRAWAGDTPMQPWMIVNVATSVATSLAMAIFATRRLPDWLRGQFSTPQERFVPVFAAMLAANGVLLYAYMRDAALSPAGLLYSLAAYPAIVWLLRRTSQRSMPSRIVLTALIGVMTTGWAIRVAGVSLNQRETAFRNRIDWVGWPVDRDRQGRPLSPAGIAITRELKMRAQTSDVPSPRLAWPLSERWADNAD